VPQCHTQGQGPVGQGQGLILKAKAKVKDNNTAKKWRFLQKKKQNCIINVLSKVRFTENIEIQPEPRFRGLFNEYFEYLQTPPLQKTCRNASPSLFCYRRKTTKN